MKKINWIKLIGTFIIVHLTAFIGSLFTNPDTDWYNSIKPGITPPDYVFPIVWTILFIFIWIAFYLACIYVKEKDRNKVRLVFLVNLILNALWSYLFFGLQNPLFAFYELILLWVSIISILLVTYKINKTSFYLIIPYLLWVSFAGVLNYLIAFG
jgi:tryptophan-rich sensory protein